MTPAQRNQQRARIGALNSVIRSRGTVWPGGYPLAAVSDDGEIICHECCRDELDIIYRSTRDGDRDGWCIQAAEVHWEGPDWTCAHCNDAIPSAYGDPDAEREEEERKRETAAEEARRQADAEHEEADRIA